MDILADQRDPEILLVLSLQQRLHHYLNTAASAFLQGSTMMNSGAYAVYGLEHLTKPILAAFTFSLEVHNVLTDVENA